jgi:glyoxylase-like metal-dependent hydrolase (beta-lactamase superfamily II)
MSNQDPIVLHPDDIFLEGDNDRLLPSLGLGAKILHTPGHTEDSISVLFPNGDCLVGDAIMNWPLNFLGSNPFPILIQDHIALKTSWDKLKTSGAKRLFPAHGKPIDIESLVSSKPPM